MEGLKVPRAGLHIAHLKKNRIEPAHALAMALQPEQAARSYNLAADSQDIQAWLRGESLPVPLELHGWTLVTVDGLPVSWGKASSGQLKNHLPKGLRILKAQTDGQ
ncbi:Ribosomal RNA small subunit methyltransferase F [compost metagenome]